MRVKRSTIRPSFNSNLVIDLKSLSEMPFEMIMIIVGYCGSDESFRLISINRETRLSVLKAKTVIFKKLFVKGNSISVTTDDFLV